MLNPSIKFAKSKGIDIPLMTWYLAGRISGEDIEKCIAWRKEIRNHYKNYEKENGEYVSYPFSFLDPLNSKEFESIDKQGLTSHISPNAIYDGDKLSVETAQGIIANMDDFFEDGLLKFIPEPINDSKDIIISKLWGVIEKSKNRRENLGTICEVAWCLWLQKPLILIVPEQRKEIFEKHPFMKRASVIVTSVKQLLKEKHLETFYRRIAGAIY